MCLAIYEIFPDFLISLLPYKPDTLCSVVEKRARTWLKGIHLKISRCTSFSSFVNILKKYGGTGELIFNLQTENNQEIGTPCASSSSNVSNEKLLYAMKLFIVNCYIIFLV